MADEAHDQPYDGSVDQPNYPKEERRDERINDIEQAQKEAKDKPDKGSTPRSLQRGLPVPPPSGHLLHEPQIFGHDGYPLYREPLVGEVVDGSLGLRIGVVRGHYYPSRFAYFRFGFHRAVSLPLCFTREAYPC